MPILSSQRLERVAMTLLLLATAAPAATAERSPLFTAHSMVHNGQLTVSLSPGTALMANVQTLPQRLREGFRSAVSFQFRLYRKRRLFSFLGDLLLCDTTVERTARWDPYTRRFVVEERPSGERRSFTEAAAFLKAFLSLENHSLTSAGRIAGIADAYLQARLHLSPIEVARSVRLIALVTGSGDITTKWLLVALPEQSHETESP